MAVTQSPTLYGVSTFDANNDQAFEYIWDGPTVAHAKLVVSRDETGAQAATVTNAGGFTIVLPANSLVNNQMYKAYVVLLDNDNVEVSGHSNEIKFQCFTTPTFSLVTEGDIEMGSIFNLDKSQYRFQVKYVQNEGDYLSQVQFVLYDSNNAVLQERPVQYFNRETTYASEVFMGFLDNKDYKIIVTGRSFSGVSVSATVMVRVRYESQSEYSKMELTNQKDAGAIRLQSNFVNFSGRTLSGNPVFIDDKELDVRNDRVIFDHGYAVRNDWCIGMNISHITKNVELFTWHSDVVEATVYYREDNFTFVRGTRGYFELVIDNSTIIVRSNLITPIVSQNDHYTIWIKKKNGLYTITCFKLQTAPIARTPSYTGTPHDLILPGAAAEGVYMYRLRQTDQYSLDIPQATNAGNYTVYWQVVNGSTIISTGYTLASISKAANSIVAPTVTTLQYNGELQRLIPPTTATFGPVLYRLDQDAQYSNTPPMAMNADTYIVWYCANGDENHEAVAPQKVSVTISRSSSYDKPGAYVSKDYTGQTLNNDYIAPSGIIVTGDTSGELVGEYIAYYQPDENHQWSDGTSDIVLRKLVITRASVGSKPTTNINKTYTGSTLTNDYTTPTGVTQSGSSSGKNAGVYTAYYTPDSNHMWSNNTFDAAEVVLNILRASCGAKPEKTYETNYTGQSQGNGYTPPTGVNTTGSTSGTDVGTYKATYTPDDNHAWSDGTTVAVERTMAIVKAAGRVDRKPTAKTLTYNGSAQELVTAGSGTGTMQYSTSESYGYGSTIPKQTNAGNYTVYYYADESTNYGKSLTDTVQVTIAKANPVVTDPTPKSNLVYTGANMNLINLGSVTGGTLYYGLGESSQSAPDSWQTTSPQGKDAKTYYIWIKVTGNSNYNDVAPRYVTSVSISAASAGDKPTTSVSKTYNGSVQNNGYDKPTTVTMTGSNSGTNVGTYQATYTPVTGYKWSDGTNTPVTVTLTINVLSLLIPTVSGGGTYNGSVYTAAVSGYNSTYETQSGQVSATNANTYTVTWSLRDKTNTKWSDNSTTDKSGTWTITPKSISGATVNLSATSKTYTGSQQSVSVSSVVLSGFTPTYTTGGTLSATNAGSYTVTVTGTGNFTGSASASWTINRAEVSSYPPSTASRPYNGSTQNNGYTTPTGINMTGQNSGKTAGTYTANYIPDANHCWPDGRTVQLTTVLTISKAKVLLHWEYNYEDFVGDSIAAKSSHNSIYGIATALSSVTGTISASISIGDGLSIEILNPRNVSGYTTIVNSYARSCEYYYIKLTFTPDDTTNIEGSSVVMWRGIEEIITDPIDPGDIEPAIAT